MGYLIKTKYGKMHNKCKGKITEKTVQGILNAFLYKIHEKGALDKRVY